MIGETFGEIEDQFGPFSMVYCDHGEMLFVFEKHQQVSSSTGVLFAQFLVMKVLVLVHLFLPQ